MEDDLRWVAHVRGLSWRSAVDAGVAITIGPRGQGDRLDEEPDGDRRRRVQIQTSRRLTGWHRHRGPDWTPSACWTRSAQEASRSGPRMAAVTHPSRALRGLMFLRRPVSSWGSTAIRPVARGDQTRVSVGTHVGFHQTDRASLVESS